MSTVYIIGNGFDLNVGLKTSYRDFVTSDIFKDRVDHENELLNYLRRVYSNSNWIDIETELALYSKKHANEYFYRDYNELCQLLKLYIRSLNSSLLDKNSAAHKLFESTEPDEEITIINFNYTQTIERIFDSNLYYDHSDVNVIPIHGSVATDEIIFGIDDKANYNRDHSFLLKSSSNQFKGKECRKALKNAEQLIIFGHSLGESDHIYFNDLFQEACMYDNKETEITIYCYGEIEQHKILKQLHHITGCQLSKLRTNTILKTIDVLRM